ncbi:High-affinity branched-chain amino acid transport system permease protein LivH [Thermoflexales bacterium]|nr:High-affinity branched-chain amino acid transport system permease protein LivH [Thermoflexales bacterium]
MAQNIVYGLFVGGIYGIAAVGLALAFGVMNVLNIAHGELLMFGGYISFWLFSLLGIDPFVSLIICIPALFLIGLLLDRLVYRHVARLRGEAKIKNSLLISFGLVLILQNVAIRLFTADERTTQVSYIGQGINLFGIALPYTRLMGLVIALVTILALHLFLQRTDSGKAIRATAEDWEAAELSGINVPRVYMLTFALGAALAGIAGTLVSVTSSVAPSIGLDWTLKALIVVVLAGTGSIIGAFPAGLLLGLVEALSSIFISASYREVVGLVIFLLVLLIRPQGLFGSREAA